MKHFLSKKFAAAPLELMVESEGTDLVAVNIRGKLKNSCEKISYSVTVQDMTDGTGVPFMWLGADDYSLVQSCSVTSSQKTVAKNAVYKDWVKIMTFPKNRFQFARKGDRVLAFDLVVQGSKFELTANYIFQQLESGFEDLADAQTSLYSSVFCLIAGFRESVPEKGINLAEQAAAWLLEESKEWSELEKKILYDRFRNIAESVPPVVSWRQACDTYCEALRDAANSDFRNGVVRLFYGVLVGEGEISNSDLELPILYDLCIALGVTNDLFARLTDKLILSCNIERHDPDILLGMHPQMTVAEQKKILRSEYKKWNERATHSDDRIRSKATAMLDVISSRRESMTAVS